MLHKIFNFTLLQLPLTGNALHNGRGPVKSSPRVAIRSKAAGGGKGERKAAKTFGTGDLRIGFGPDQFSLDRKSVV